MSKFNAAWYDREQPRSLRLRLALWYGALVALALLLFAALVLILASNAIGHSVDDAVDAQSGIALVDLRHELSPAPPYWPPALTLHAVDTYRDPGTAVEVRDLHGATRSRSPSDSTAMIPVTPATLSAVRGGQTRWYTTKTDSERVRVKAQPVYANTIEGTPAAGRSGASAARPVIGVLLVAKSLRDVDSTLRLLNTLIVVTGLLTLAAAVIGGWAIAGRVLHPLKEIGATARSIAAATASGTRLGGLSQRVRRPTGHDELAQVVDTFNAMLANLESATQAQRRFVADASHELRAPLTTVQGNLAFLQRHVDELPPDERRTMLSDAHGETLRLARLVDELLLLARMDASSDTPPAVPNELDAGARAPRPEPPVELDRAIVQLVRQLRGRLKAEGSPLTLELGHIQPARVRGDEETLRRVALILLDNAIKYTPAPVQGAGGTIAVSLDRVDGDVVLRVRDTGIGIEPDDLAHIFERFYRADRARGRQGTGLGLAIASALVERLGGRLTAESTVGQGSTFSVRLPVADQGG